MIRALLAALMFALAAPAAAQVYLSLGATVSRASQDIPAEFSGRGVGSSVGVGFDFSRRFAVGASWYSPDQLGHYGSRVSSGADITTTAIAQTADGFKLSGFLYPLNGERWAAFVSANLYVLHGESATAVSTTNNGVITSSSSITTTGSDTLAGIGAGVEYRFMDKASLRVHVDAFNTSAKLYGDTMGKRRVVNATFDLVKRF